AAHRLETGPETLRAFGFELVHVAGPGESAAEMGLRAARAALAEAGVAAEQVGAIVYAAAIPPSAMLVDDAGGAAGAGAAPGGLLDVDRFSDFFKSPAGKLQHELGARQASVLGINQQGCTALFGAIRSARGLLAAEPDLDHVLCVSADRLAPGATREMM